MTVLNTVSIDLFYGYARNLKGVLAAFVEAANMSECSASTT